MWIGPAEVFLQKIVKKLIEFVSDNQRGTVSKLPKTNVILTIATLKNY